MKAAYIYDDRDVQGPWVLLCEACLDASSDDPWAPHGDVEWIHEDRATWRCACCGCTSDDEPLPSDTDGVLLRIAL